MSSNQLADAHAMQREKEREKRRLRDRQRRQSMSQEQREKHLARRRKNYQLRRLRAQNNVKIVQSNHSYTSSNITSNDESELKSINSYNSSSSHGLLEVQPSYTDNIQDGPYILQKYPKTRLRVTDIRHLARRLHCDDKQLNGGVTTGVAIKRLKLTHVKRLARAVKVTEE